jgi:type IV pilus assembly protein PilV
MMKNLIKQKAFTLLEVMVALVIFSIGLLGLAGLQSAGIYNNQISYSRTLATQHLYDLADRIRNNPGIDYGAVSPSGANNCVTGADCTPAQMAAYDVFEWNQHLVDPEPGYDSPLTNAVGFISLTGNTYTLSVGWDQNHTGSTPNACLPSPDPADIMCVTIVVER